jgi:hypothetical protein
MTTTPTTVEAHETETIIVVRHKTFTTLDEAYAWGAELSRKTTVIVSRLRQDFFKRVLPRDNHFKLLGVQKSAEKVCKRLEPDGHWSVEVEAKGTEYVRVAPLFGDTHTHVAKQNRLMAWYSRFLPYAIAMVQAEGYFPNARGIDFESINAYYGTCMGFVSLGQDPPRHLAAIRPRSSGRPSKSVT